MELPVAVADDPACDAERQTVAAQRQTLPAVVWLIAVAGALTLLYVPTVLWLIDRWTMSVWHNAHGMFIPFIVGYFAKHELKRVSHLPAQASAWGFAFLVPALALHILDTAIHTQLLSAASLVIALPGVSLLLLGPVKTRAIAFPLAMMALMLPIPLAFTEPLHLVLRQIATVLSAQVIPLLGITTFVEGTTIHLSDATLQIGDACSGFSTLYAACSMAALTAYTCSSWRRRIVVLAAAAPLAIAANVIRIVLLVVAIESAGIGVLSTWVHPGSGMLTFVLSLPVILWLGSNSKDARA